MLWPHLDARTQGAGLQHARVGMEYPHALLFPTRSSAKFEDSKLSKRGQTFADNQLSQASPKALGAKLQVQ